MGEGGANEPMYDMAGFSNLTNTIVVNMNYRLGWLGFLPLESEGIDGNQGVKDQRLAMKWVYENIEAFGGDNTQITLFGESAGAQSVLFHLLSKESAPYFHRAILQSFIAYPYQNKREMSTVAGLMQTQFKLRFKCGLAMNAIDCLRKVPYEEYLKLNDLSQPSSHVRAFHGARARYVPLALDSQVHMFVELNQPWYDVNPLELLERGKWNSDKEIIIGHTDGEDDYYNYIQLTKEVAQEKAQALFGNDIGSKVVSLYEGLAQNPVDYGEMFGEMILHGWYSCYAKALARKMSATGSGKVYFYEFAQPWQVTDVETGELVIKKAQHAGELQYLFRNVHPYMEAYLGTEGDLQVMEMMTDYWGSFARGASPRSSKYSSWPQYQVNGDKNVLKIAQPNSTITNGNTLEQCKFWEASGILKRS